MNLKELMEKVKLDRRWKVGKNIRPHPMSTHTPGPWAVDYNRREDRYQLRSEKQGSFGHFQGWSADGLTTEDEDKANARLIAAAPDLLAALEAAVNNYAQLVEAMEWITRCAKMSGPAGTTAWFISEGHMEKCRSLVAAASPEETTLPL